MVPGNFPLGCSAVYLTLFRSLNKTVYDSIGCLKAFNAFSELHNSRLQRSLETLRQKYPHTKIIYADYYGATMRFILEPERYGELTLFENYPRVLQMDITLVNRFISIIWCNYPTLYVMLLSNQMKIIDDHTNFFYVKIIWKSVEYPSVQHIRNWKCVPIKISLIP